MLDANSVREEVSAMEYGESDREQGLEQIVSYAWRTQFL